MLRSKCSIPAKAYFLAVVLDDGKEMTFATPRLADSDITSFYDKTSFLGIARRASIGRAGSNPFTLEPFC